ncbi:MAG: PqqD family protein [Pseudonocardiaceae bacterium]
MNGLRIPEVIKSVVSPDGAVLLDTRAGRVVGLNPTGAVIWDRLRAGADAEQIAGELAARYDVDRDRVRADVLGVISTLLDRGVLDAGTTR